MPPKGRKGKKKGKKDEVRVARPEPVDGDDRELAMLWEKVGAVGPNPFAPQAHHNMYVTASAAIPSGPLSGAFPVPTAPQGMTSWPSAAASPDGKDGGQNQAQQERLVSPPTTGQAFKPTVLDQQIPATGLNARVVAAGAAPAAPMGVLPPRHKSQDGRAAHAMLSRESEFLRAEQHQLEAKEEETELLNAIDTETKEFVAARTQLASDIQDLEEQKVKEHEQHVQELTLQTQAFDTDRILVEETLHQLEEEREEVLRNLQQKSDTLRSIAECNEKIEEMAIAHVARVKELSETLSTKKQRLKATMNTKMKRTVEELSSLTADQHAARRERAEQERERLTAELAAAERQARALAARMRRLTNTTDMLRRDVALESERRTFLSKKNAALTRSLQKLVGDLEDLERQFATQAAARPEATSQRAGQVEAMHDDAGSLTSVVDQQYEIILQLRHDMVALGTEIQQARNALQDKQRAAMQPDAAATGALTTADGLRGVKQYNALVQAAIGEAVADMERGFVGAGRKLEDVSQTERQSLLDYLVKRVNNAVLGFSGTTAGTLIPRPPQDVANV